MHGITASVHTGEKHTRKDRISNFEGFEGLHEAYIPWYVGASYVSGTLCTDVPRVALAGTMIACLTCHPTQLYNSPNPQPPHQLLVSSPSFYTRTNFIIERSTFSVWAFD